MKRAYYTDPIAALWMNKHFDIMFNGNGEMCPITWADITDENQPIERYHIHPDSMPILEALPEETMAALKHLGMWPEFE